MRKSFKFIFWASIIVYANCFEHFITRNVDKLMDGSNEFRFISFNVPGMTVVEDPEWHLVSDWEQEDVFRSISQLGGRVIRVYTFSIKKASDPPNMKRHIYAPRKYDEDLFKSFDKMLQLANKYGIRIVVPFIDQWWWWGGIEDFKAFRKAANFWDDQRVRQDFKDLITDILNRENTFTGIKYKDDKAILAWETGNELSPKSSEWTADIAAHIKSIDQNHLVMDGRYGIDINSLKDKNIDMVSDHFYLSISTPYAERCRQDRKLTAGMKPLFVGEFGITTTKMIRDLLDEVISNGTPGALIWSLRPHNKVGGYYKHKEGSSKFWSYHWPGFEQNNDYDEMAVIELMREKAYRIQGKPMPPQPVPDPPGLLDILSVKEINWQGSVGARWYDVARAENKEGQWEIIAENISDCKQIETEGPVFKDEHTISGKQYYYKVKAKNPSGESDWSNIVGPVRA